MITDMEGVSIFKGGQNFGLSIIDTSLWFKNLSLNQSFCALSFPVCINIITPKNTKRQKDTVKIILGY